MLNIIEMLLKNELFMNFTEKELKKFIDADTCVMGQYKKNKLICQEDDYCWWISFILEGEVSVQQLSQSGEEVTLFTLKEGASYGESILFAAYPYYLYNVIAVKDTKILFISFEQIKNMLKSSFSFNINYLKALSNRFELYKEKIEILSQKDARSRLIFCLSNEAKRQKNLSFTLPYSKTVLSSWVGMARPSVSRELSRMQSENIIQMENRNIRILKPEIFNLTGRAAQGDS